ncbi:type III-B CRISPR module RAMP protein Cmr1 [Alysiella filiformis]|uniref:CRISPR-associated protein Cmr1 n=1 Tax=Alysiella filiformis DSM 16848 TaxID=1120981 RepID=A0A286EDB0_9NEIS|nr:type III-B CRISPR module RAMP protein Cmr1 [Alysiella filiformis]QMT31183.1 type III-B CRISPR module RAMP protein Cmr1 [Alysiella filiformis]UBQ55822.1 type III-B CRISPR module RAMP protein Cmr1 [Alysiella filiformis DSM 16848]SOD68891.1 CRISPR-associated protein Cmr1 [Alysiella filiformis DSM 16848]
MSLRKIDEKIAIPNLADFQAAVPKWESIQCRLVTPMYGGGVKSAEPDIQQPIRVTAIRGQLRFWWRLLASQKVFRLPENLNIRQAEFALWGGMNDGDESGKASAVFLRIKQFSSPKKIAYFNQWDNDKKTRLRNRNKELLPNSYVLFAMDSEDDPNKTNLIDKDLTWDLEWYLDRNADIFWSKKKENGQEIRDQFLTEKYQDTLSQVIETLRWWTTFGGMGARTRRGCGAFMVEKSTLPEIQKAISIDEIQGANCKLSVANSNSNDAMDAWKLAVKRLRDFRQGVNVGRNEPSPEAKAARKPAGRSRWTEHDAIRRLTNQYPNQHKPEHEGGNNQFPRGMFGMPIIFYFVDGGEPSDTSLQPVGKERMASPLIIRPILQNGQWKAAALLLPHDFSNLQVELKIDNNNRRPVVLLDKGKANDIKPIAGNGGGDPLSAFMNYFANPTTQQSD